jgi:PAS domain S-box-containing protein
VAVSPGSTTGALVTIVFLLTFGAFAAGTAVRRVRMTSPGRRRKAWLTISVGLFLGVLANGLGLVFDVAGLSGWFGIVDALLVCALILCVVALTMAPPTPRRGTDLVRLIMDGLVIGGSVLFLASVTIFPTLLAGRQSSPLAELQVLALPVLDLVITTLATLMIARSATGSRTPLRLLGAAFLLYAVSDMAYAVNVSAGAAGLGSWWDLGWLGGYLLVSLSALHPEAGHQPEPESRESSSLRSTVVCFAIFLVAAGTSMIVDTRGDMYLAPRVVWGLLILAVVLRQIALVLDNEQLRRSLETRVTERTKELQQITRQRELLLASVADGIYGVDRDGRITMVNEATTKLLGRSEDQLLGADAHELLHAPRSDGSSYPKETCYITEATRSGLTVSGEEDVYMRGDGERIVVEATASPLTGEQGITGAVVVIRDVSQRREMDRMKQEFISFVSHELRTPLTSIRGALGLIAGGALGDVPPRAAKMIDIANSGSVRLGRLVDDILDIERLDSGMLPLSIAGQDAAPACREAVLATSGMAQAAGIRLELGTVSGRVLADRDRLVQVLINLVGNAVRFSDPGDFVRLAAAHRGDVVRFSVSDTGRGIPADKLDAIFGRFSQVDSSGSREKGGTGLGLAISRGLVDRMGGRIWVDSTLGEGSTFHVELPADGVGSPQSPSLPVLENAIAR